MGEYPFLNLLGDRFTCVRSGCSRALVRFGCAWALPFLHIRDGLEARIQRSVFYRLVEEGELENDALMVRSDGEVFNLGSVV